MSTSTNASEGVTTDAWTDETSEAVATVLAHRLVDSAIKMLVDMSQGILLARGQYLDLPINLRCGVEDGEFYRSIAERALIQATILINSTEGGGSNSDDDSDSEIH